METNFKGTKGNEFKVIPSDFIRATNVYLGDFKGEVTFWHHHGDTHTKKEAEANAELFCDALNIRQQINCDLPELLEQRNEMLNILKSINNNSSTWNYLDDDIQERIFKSIKTLEK